MRYGRLGAPSKWFWFYWNFDYERGPRQIVIWCGNRRYGITL